MFFPRKYAHHLFQLFTKVVFNGYLCLGRCGQPRRKVSGRGLGKKSHESMYSILAPIPSRRAQPPCNTFFSVRVIWFAKVRVWSVPSKWFIPKQRVSRNMECECARSQHRYMSTLRMNSVVCLTERTSRGSQTFVRASCVCLYCIVCKTNILGSKLNLRHGNQLGWTRFGTSWW